MIIISMHVRHKSSVHIYVETVEQCRVKLIEMQSVKQELSDLKSGLSNSTSKIFSPQPAETLSAQNWQTEKNNFKKLLQTSLNDLKKSRMEAKQLEEKLQIVRSNYDTVSRNCQEKTNGAEHGPQGGG